MSGIGTLAVMYRDTLMDTYCICYSVCIYDCMYRDKYCICYIVLPCMYLSVLCKEIEL